MHLVKTFAVGAVVVLVSNKLAGMDFVTKASPTVAKFAPYLISGGLLVAAKKFSLV
jgi:hypothetical protein